MNAEAVLGVRATHRKPTPSKPSTDEEAIRAPLIGDDDVPKDPRDMRKNVLDKRVEPEDESGVGLPRPEISDKYDHTDVRMFRITDAMLVKF